MPIVAPFRSLRYSAAKVGDFASVVTPPYDVISPAEQDEFYALSPCSMVRLELGKAGEADCDLDSPHTRAAACLAKWREEGILTRDDAPAMYVYDLEFSLPEGGRAVRRGYLCALRLEEFEAGGVLPHEKTFAAIKDERLARMTACAANLSPIFALYPDREDAVRQALDAGREAEPLMAFTDRGGNAHTLWRVTDESALRRAAFLMGEKTIFIADGHHRYETALRYRDIQRASHPFASPRAPFEYVMVYLSGMSQEGLVIFPTHRILRALPEFCEAAFLTRAANYFEVRAFEPTAEGLHEFREALAAGASRGGSTIGYASRPGRGYWTLSIRAAKVAALLAEQGTPPELASLDVVVLDRVVFGEVMGLTETFLGDSRNIRFSHDFAETVAAVREGTDDAAFFLNATRIEQVERVALAGLTMPRKATYFYPKVMSGMVVNPLDPGEELPW